MPLLRFWPPKVHEAISLPFLEISNWIDDKAAGLYLIKTNLCSFTTLSALLLLYCSGPLPNSSLKLNERRVRVSYLSSKLWGQIYLHLLIFTVGEMQKCGEKVVLFVQIWICSRATAAAAAAGCVVINGTISGMLIISNVHHSGASQLLLELREINNSERWVTKQRQRRRRRWPTKSPAEHCAVEVVLQGDSSASKRPKWDP